jgi:hypothetical protein
MANSTNNMIRNNNDMRILGFLSAFREMSFTFRRQSQRSRECWLLLLSGAPISRQRLSFVILQRPNGKTLSQYFDVIFNSVRFERIKLFTDDKNTTYRDKIKEKLQHSNMPFLTTFHENALINVIVLLF